MGRFFFHKNGKIYFLMREREGLFLTGVDKKKSYAFPVRNE